MQSLPLSSDTHGAVGAPISASQSHECFQSPVPDYAVLFFDHLYSEYLTLRSMIKDPLLLDLVNSIHDKRMHSQLTWSDIYTFDLALIEERPLENLIRKAYDARAKYRSIAGQKEFDEYVASKPPDLTSILIAPHPESEPAAGNPPEQPDESAVELPPSSDIVQRVLRADIRYLLSKFYLYYAMLPMREKKREELTSRAVRMTKWILLLIIGLIILSAGGLFIIEKIAHDRYGYRGDVTGVFGLTVGSVAFAGIVGGCVSMLQRIQSAPTEGDALFNLASLTNGWRGLSLSPLYGGIFASLLFILFAAGVLEGTIFPKIATAKSYASRAAAQSAVLAPPQSATATDTETEATPTTSPAPPPEKALVEVETKPLTATQATGILQVTDFLKETGPEDGIAFALLIIWSFIAGFAERLVPDTLNRLVAKNEAIQGTN